MAVSRYAEKPQKGECMMKLTLATCFFLTTISGICQSVTGYEVATVLEVKTHQAAGGDTSNPSSYDVSVRVGDRIYVVLYTSPSGLDIVTHKTGQNLLIQVGKNTITYNDILGRSIEVPIESQRQATAGTQSK